MIGHHALAEQLSDVASKLLGAGEIDATLQRIVELAVATIDGCDHAGISSVVDQHVETLAQSDHLPRALAELQNALGEGPCLDAVGERAVFETGDFSSESRWPRFCAEVVARTGVHSALSMRLHDERDTIGALNLYARTKDAFDDRDRGIAPIFAAHAAYALRAAWHHHHLITAIETRDIIGQAKGIIMARTGTDDAGAFEILRDGANRLDCKLRDLAHQIVDHQQQPR